MGKHCEECLPGYYGDALTGVCQICSCPLPIESNKSVSINRLSNKSVSINRLSNKSLSINRLPNKSVSINRLGNKSVSLHTPHISVKTQ